MRARAAWDRALDAERLRFSHAVRVIERRMPQAAAHSPEPIWRAALLAESAAAAVTPTQVASGARSATSDSAVAEPGSIADTGRC